MVWWKYVCAVVLGMAATVSLTYGEEVDLVQALEEGQVWAQFRGWGEDMIGGRVGRSPYGPQQIGISPGTQFQAQRRGVQGMSSLGWTHIDLRNQSIAHVRIPAACTNLGLRTPTAGDALVLARRPNANVARVANVIARRRPPHPAAQLAMWAVASNPARAEIEPYLQRVASQKQAPVELERSYLLGTAGELLRIAKLRPRQFRMFQ